MTDPAIVQDGASSVGLGDAGKRVMEQYGLEKEISKAEKAQSAAKKAGEAQIMSQYGSVLSKPYEEFKPSQESASGFAALGSLLMVAGGMMGGSGRMAGIGAMNNIAGMMKGYQQGRKDLYEQERTQFEENMKVFEKNRTLIKEAFDRALKMAPYNLTTAQNNLRKELAGLGASIPAEMTAKSGLVQAASQHDTFHTNTTNTLEKLKEQLGRSRAEASAQAADLKAQEDKYKLEKERREAGKPEGGLTPGEALRDKNMRIMADKIVAEKRAPANAAEQEALDIYGPKDYKPETAQYGPMAVFERAVPGSSSAFKTQTQQAEAQGVLIGVNEAKKVLAASTDKDIAFGKIPVFLQNVEQGVRANLDYFKKADANGVLPNGKTVDQMVEEIINSTPADPNDKNAVFQKDAAFAALAVERAARGGSMLPLGFLKTLGPLLDPKQYTREGFQGVYASRVKELDDKLVGYGFNKDERNKIYDTYSQLRGDRAAPKTPAAASTSPVVSLKDIEFTAQKHGKTVDEVKKILRDAGKKIEGE